jgi:hypothetical protein
MPIFRGKQFVSAVTDYKDSVRVALRTPLNLANAVTVIDGVTLNDKDRVLLAGQSLATQNGIYEWSSATSRLARADDSDSIGDLTAGTRIYVESGNTYALTTWVLITTGTIIPGTTNITFSKENRIGPVDISGLYGNSSQTLVVTLTDTGQIDSIVATDINVDGGEF